MQPGLISVVLPNHNHARYLGQALAALRAQTLDNFEIVLVDDASTDESCALVEGMAAIDGRIRLIRLDCNVGVNAAVAHGLTQARGEFLYCAAADDWVAPEFFERSAALLQAHPAAAFCFSDPMEDRGQREAFPLFLSAAPRAFSADELLAELRRNYFHFSSNTVLYRRALFEQAGGFRTDLHWLSDWFVNNVLALRHGAVYLPEALTCLTVRGDSYSAMNLRRHAIQRELMLKVIDLLAEPDFADVGRRFRAAALLPEYRLRDISWLLAAPAHRGYLSAPLVRRILGRGVWNYLRPLAPAGLRRMIRRRSRVQTH